jgi:UDP-N-acetylmuramate--alanine ligase
LIANAAKKFGHKNVIYTQDKKNIPSILSELKKDNDIIITMGAGDIWKYGEEFIRMIKN